MGMKRQVSDEMWNQMEPYIWEARRIGGATPRLSDRDFVEAILHMARNGMTWRNLPSEYGHWGAVYMRFRRWEKMGLWQRLWQGLRGKGGAKVKQLFIDSTTVRAHHHAAGAPKKTAAARLWDALGAA